MEAEKVIFDLLMRLFSLSSCHTYLCQLFNYNNQLTEEGARVPAKTPKKAPE